MHRFVRLTVVSLVLGAALAVLLAASVAAAPTGRAKVSGSVPPWAKAAALKSPANGAEAVGFQVYLGWRHAGRAAALAKAVSEPSSAAYGRYLSPAKFRSRFAPSKSAVAAVVNWLKSQGFTIAGIPANHLYVAAKGTVAQAESAFRVRLNEYSVQGLTLRAPASPVTIPASLAHVVTGVVGLDQGGALTHPLSIRDIGLPPAGYRTGQPTSLYWGQNTASDQPQAYGTYLPYAVNGYTPAQLRGAYGVTNAIKRGNDGRGVTVADYRRFRRADDRLRRQSLLQRQRRAHLQERPVHTGLGSRSGPGAGQRGRAGLVRRGDARRRGRAPHGSRCADRVRGRVFG